MRKFIINKIQEMSGKYTVHQIFSDWILMEAMAIQNSCYLQKDEMYNHREKMYLNVANKYTKEELKDFADMSGALTLILEERFGDILGEIYMESNAGQKKLGQFFTPYHVSLLTAKLSYQNQFSHLNEDDVIEVNEPSVGGGGMMIAVAQTMKEAGLNHQKNLHITAQDLDWNGVYMTYIQLSLLGIKAVVVQGDSLLEPYRKGYDQKRVLRTPAEMGAIL